MVFSYDRGEAAVSLNAVNGSNILGDIVSYPPDVHGHLPSHATYQLTISGTVTALNLDIYGSHDGTNFALLKNVTSTTNEIDVIAKLPVAYLQGRLNSVTGTGTVTLSFEV